MHETATPTIDSTAKAQRAAAPRLHGVLGEFESPAALIAACEKVRDAGFTRWDAHSPFPIHGIDEAIGIRMTRLPWLVFALGATGCGVGIGLQWWANATDALDFSWLPTFVQGYDYRVSGKPAWSFPANIPVIFELTVLLAAFGAFFGMLVRNNLPQFSQPILHNRRFRGNVTTDGYYIAIDAADPLFEESRAGQFLTGNGALAVERIEDVPSEPLRLPWFKPVATAAAVVALIPVAIIARAWTAKSESPRIHIIQDMDNQEKYKAQAAMPLFADKRAMRPAVPGAVARGEARLDDHYERGLVGGAYATEFPARDDFAVTDELLRRGQQRFGIYCAPCHGLDGSGNGPVNVRATELGGSWVPAADLVDDERRARPVGQIYNTITNGIRTMPAYADKLTPEDRWAVVAYVRALQHARYAPLEKLPAELAEQLDGR